jgi:D-glycero-alpha-D-manno-heptose-7-phosphate kinase
MIISKTPLRISFVGGGTDLPSFYKKDFGAVLSCTIDKYVYVIIKERFDDLIYVNWSKKEIVTHPDEIEHDLVREALKKVGIDKGVEITMLADIPSEGSGLGSSSSLTVGLLNAFYEFKGVQVSTDELAREACEIEIEVLGKPIGKQDHYAAAFGGINEIIFYRNGEVNVTKVDLSSDKLRALGSNLLMYYTDITRKADSILRKQQEKSEEIFEKLAKMRDKVLELKDHLENGGHDILGVILDQSWKIKRSLHPMISNRQIDMMYEIALEAGTIGGKVCGAGGGGFLLLYVPGEKQDNVRKALKKYREFPFMLEKYGSRIIFNHISDYWK